MGVSHGIIFAYDMSHTIVLNLIVTIVAAKFSLRPLLYSHGVRLESYGVRLTENYVCACV